MISDLASEASRVQGKRVRSLKDVLSKSNQLALYVHHNYKVAVHNESRSRFIGCRAFSDTGTHTTPCYPRLLLRFEKALKHFRSEYHHLVQITQARESLGR